MTASLVRESRGSGAEESTEQMRHHPGRTLGRLILIPPTALLLANCAGPGGDRHADTNSAAHAARARSLPVIARQVAQDGFPGSQVSLNRDYDGHQVYTSPAADLAFSYDAAGKYSNPRPGHAILVLRLANCEVQGVEATLQYAPHTNVVTDVSRYSLKAGNVTAFFNSYNGLIQDGTLGANPCATLVQGGLAN